MTREEYYLEALISSLDEHGGLDALSGDQCAAIAKDLAMAASMEGEYFGRLCIPNPENAELKRTKEQAAQEAEKLEKRANIYRRALAEALKVNERSLYIDYDRVECDPRLA